MIYQMQKWEDEIRPTEFNKLLRWDTVHDYRKSKRFLDNKLEYKQNNPQWDRCFNCGILAFLIQFHHWYYSHYFYNDRPQYLMPLCDPCHTEISKYNAEFKLLFHGKQYTFQTYFIWMRSKLRQYNHDRHIIYHNNQTGVLNG